ncbi:MAG: hypothetical protein H6867_09250 [Rhodospirillales bacterium]|nr:hypothetical protein [Rhodospirillales bacterium]MCB9996014.1 hypothetical protein [Rhodospirillales bacterium]
MSRRIYTVKAARKRLISDALETVREIRAQIDPALLEEVRNAIGAAAEQHETRQYKSMHTERVPVDQKRNLSVALKFMELQPHNKALQREVLTFMAQR